MIDAFPYLYGKIIHPNTSYTSVLNSTRNFRNKAKHNEMLKFGHFNVNPFDFYTSVPYSDFPHQFILIC